ncbi:biopolymer transporter ExbD [Hymenobacter busanensis]|uniref:Biopolymer transporter ExbD n=1 Tax=Hymenobacter busanensis TaxID=2607656 RepID=A0A7L4ZYX5_9BACT|nr:biopolymer transporter ExbD [Hymenobacter busanensis]KAA9331550.1 biopolymer transporter ExbD [Hymenobacter busanensis]QHJ08704.1 biopolymer transporter ExbD [Hymenobacter busanensis]
MPKVKPHRKSPSLDMTPMVDLAFLLVTFFMLTATPTEDTAVLVDTPSSVSDKKLPETGVLTLAIDKEGRVFFSTEAQQVKIKALETVGAKYGVNFSQAQKRTFSLLPDFGLPVQKLGQYLNLSSEERKQVKQEGIPTDSLNNQLAEWVIASRSANIAQTGKAPYIAIKGDGQADVPTVKNVIKILQEKNLNRFYLITDLEIQPVASK